MEWTVAIGVDTHKQAHVAVALDRLGRRLGGREVKASEAGYGELLEWASSLGCCAFAVEGAGSYGPPGPLPRQARARGLRVRAADPP